MTALLIVDDSTVSRMMIHGMVDEACPEWEILEADSADRAMETLKNASPDFCSIDYHMPGMNGLELIDHIRKVNPQIRCALFTANLQDSVKEKAASLGAVCVHKPVSEDAIGEMIRFFQSV